MRASLIRMRRDRRHPLTALIAGLAVAGVLVSGGIAGQAASAKEDYPTYSDVVKARSSTAKTKALIQRIESALKGLEATAASTAADSRKAGDAAQAADQKYQEQVLKADELQSQADDAKKDADSATAQAAAMVSRLYRSGSGASSLELLLDSEHADDVLYGYSLATKLTEQTQSLYEDAKQKQNTAQSLSDQASVAQKLLKQYKDDADAAYDKAAQASEAAATALADEQSHKADLEVLEALALKKQHLTEKQYQKGVIARAKAREEAGGGGGGVDVKNGWANPEVGPITSPFGWRTLNGSSTYHLGTDIGAACGTPEYAAHEATVSYAGWNGIYGNFIRLDVGGGIQLEYGHIIDGGILVKVGQAVGAGQMISRVGKTGGATGCHLHFGVRINGVVTDPVPFMKARGITLGVG